MLSSLKKVLFCLPLLLFILGTSPLFAQETEGDNIPCKQENSGYCAVAGAPGICKKGACDTSTEAVTTTSFAAVERLASGMFTDMKESLRVFREPLVAAAATTTNNAAATANKQALTAFDANLGKMSWAFGQLESAYDTEMSSQKAAGAQPKDAHYAASIKVDQKWVELYNRDLRPLVDSPTLFPAATRVVVREFFTGKRNQITQLVASAQKIKNGESAEGSNVQIPSTLPADATRSNTGAASNTELSEDGAGCSPFSFKFDKCMNAIFSWIARVVFVNIALFVFSLAGLFLHFAIHFGLVSMKSLITEDVYTLWLFTRNLALAGCLFATLYFVGMYLVGLGEKIQKQAAAVILFAIFSGFSFTLSTYLIDGSTLVTTSLYSSIDKDWASTTKFAAPVISGKFTELLGWQGVASIAGAVSPNSVLGRISQGSNPFSGVALNLLVAATLLYDAFVLFMMGILFLVRNIGLFAAVIFSPLLLIDKAIPKLSEWADWYRKFFFGLLALGPVFMFLMYIAIKVTQVLLTGTRALSGQISGANEGLILFQIFAVTAIFYFTYKTCKSLSGALGDAALGAVSGVASKAFMATPLGMAGRVAAFAGQNTVGRVARHLTRKDENGNAVGRLAKMKEGGGYFGRAAFSAANYAGNTATYDFNNSKAFAGARGRVEKMAGMSSSESAVGKALGYADTRTKIRDETINHANEISNEGGRQRVLERGARRLDRTDSVLPALKLVDRVGDKFLGGDDRASKRTERRGVLEAEMKRGSEKNAKSAIDDKVSSLDLQNYVDKGKGDQEKLLDDFIAIYKDSKKGSEEVQKHAKKVFDNKLVSVFADVVKHDEKLDPLSPDFEAHARAKFAELSKQVGDKLGLKADDKTRPENDRKVVEKFELQMGIFVTEKRKEAREKARRQAQNASPQNNQEEAVAASVVDTKGPPPDLASEDFTLTFRDLPPAPSGSAANLDPNKQAPRSQNASGTAPAPKIEPAEAGAA